MHIELSVSGQRLRREMGPGIVGGSRYYLTAHVAFAGHDWSGCQVWLKIDQAGAQNAYLLDADGCVTAERGINLPAGEYDMSLLGLRDDVRITTNVVPLCVLQSGADSGEPLPEVPQTAAEQIAALAQQAADTARSVREDADAGMFDGAPGKDGADGAPGKDGVSATHKWDGTVLTITSASGTSSADLRGPQGERGERGETGAQGPQGEAGLDAPQDAVRYGVQALTEEEQQTARGNIGAASGEEVGSLKDDLYKLIVPGKTYQTIPGKAFNGFGKLNDFEDAFLVLVEVPAECAFLIVSNFNYQVAYGSEFRYSLPQYLDADCNQISQCKVNNGAYTVDNSNDFGIITLVDVPENAAYIAIPYKNGTEYSVEYGYVHYADNIEGSLIDGHLPYGIQLFEDGRNLVQKLFHDVSYFYGNTVFNFSKGSRCTQPVLYNGGARIYHDGTANTMYYYAFDNANGFISSGIINNGGDLPEIENAAYLIFQSVKDFTYISYSDLSLSGYKQSKKIRDDLLDLHLTQKKLKYPYHGMVASFLGDSLTANGSGGDYTGYLNSFFAFSKIKNCGIGGTCISGGSSVFGDPMWMDSRINALDIDSDIIYIMGGTNDAPSGDQYLGDITPENHDTSTFVGAYNVLLSKIFYRYGLFDGLYDGIDYSGVVQADNARDVRIFLITPPQRFPDRGSTNNPWHYAENTNLYADAVVEIGKMHGIPVADIRSCAGINIFNRDRYICGPDVSNRNGSGVHLSADAHKRWAEVIIGKMLEIVNTD